MRHLLCLLLIALWLAGGARAAVVLDQPVAFDIDGRASYIGGQTHFAFYDRIGLAQSASVNRVTWFGGFLDTATPGNNPVLQSTTTAWHFSVAADDNNAPGAVLDTTSVAAADVVASYQGVGTIAGRGTYFYAYTALLPDALDIAGGTPLWFSVLAEGSTTNPLFAWLASGSGDGEGIQIFQGDQVVDRYTDRALRLEALEVPEPPVLALAGLAMLLALAPRWRRPRRQSARS